MHLRHERVTHSRGVCLNRKVENPKVTSKLPSTLISKHTCSHVANTHLLYSLNWWVDFWISFSNINRSLALSRLDFVSIAHMSMRFSASFLVRSLGLLAAAYSHSVEPCGAHLNFRR